MSTLKFITICAAAVAAMLICARSDAHAATLSCTVSATALSFGAYDVYGAAIPGTATVSGSCRHATGSVTVTITLDNGLHATGANRGMTCSTCTGFTSDVLQYQLYTDAAHTTVWSGGAGMTATCSGCGGANGGSWGPVTMYGLIPPAVAGGINDVAAGTGYGDTVTVTISY